MQFETTPIQGVFEIKLSPYADERGVFSRLFCENELKQIGHTKNIRQVNHSLNKQKGTVRGMHFQFPPHAEIKMISCIRGKVFDVVIDLRKNSPGFLKWHSVILTPDDHNMIYIPEGCAHGFQTMEDNSELIYFHSDFYNKESEGGIRYDDPMVSIKWPLTVLNVSEKDKNYPLLNPSFSGIDIS
ncbi:MAG TPA: dTDP-4-dehydrorhamnose 3,5-epimerase [Puia sp.]|nr:dTDP-4-dehydrorhamnose 3,5-epimerase [Puia sp.]